MANPFQYEKLPPAADFCGRRKEAETLLQLINGGENAVLIGDRRYGKISLIEHVFRDLPKNRLHTFTDLFACTESQDVAVCLYEAVYSALPFDLERKVKEISGVFTRVKLRLEISSSGATKLSTQLLSQEFEQLIEDALIGADQLCEKLGVTLIIVLDEFQQVAKIKDKRVDAVLRIYMQRLKHVSFIFSGSKKRILSGLFIDKKKPLYGMATSISLGGIETELFKAFCERKLGRRFEPGAFEQLYDEVRGQTKLILQTSCYLYASDTELTKEHVNEVLDGIIADKDEEYKMLFNSYTNQQKKAIRMIGRYHGRHLYSEPYLTKFRIKKQSLHQVLSRLIEVGDVAQLEDNRYVVSDVYFHLWIVRKFG